MDNNETYLDDEHIKLTDLLEVEVLQFAQDTVSRMARMATLLTDEEGVPITKGSRFSRLCMDFCRQTPEGRKRCEACDKMGAITSLEQNKAVYYFCHANLVDFAAPIMLNGRIIGSFIGGQVLSAPPDLEAMRKTAREIGVDEEEFVKAAQENSIIPLSAIERCTNFIYDFAQILSTLAYKAYVAKRESMIAYRAATAKTDFLANMSHEIRTPMNAIIGMSQIALREEMSDRARDYINQVVSSANMLLTIINDILDYSKLEAGKMSVVEEEYSPVNLIREVSSIISERALEKDIEFIIDFDPTLPSIVYGDDVRIKQIILNLANNAVKFTNEGHVMLRVWQTAVDSNTIMLHGSVIDTGIGIKKENIGKLFNSFEQVDSKRNRKVEGTGLGLAIVKDLVESMHGTISVQSEYEVGSVFSFEIPQKVLNSVRCVDLLSDCPCVVGLFHGTYYRQQIQKSMEILGAQYIEASSADFSKYLEENKEDDTFAFADYIFVEESFLPENYKIPSESGSSRFVVVCDQNSRYTGADNQIVLRKPISIIEIAAVLQNKNIRGQSLPEPEENLLFKAPKARALIVDDNDVNLSVAVGLLEPLEIQLDTADSGIKALEMVSQRMYDIIFMDHMMPEMDGVEVTQAIRSFHPEYSKTPIIALSANVLNSSRELFMSSGMDDFVAKPIEFSALVSCLKKWLPEEYIIPVDAMAPFEDQKNLPTKDKLSGIHFLDTKYALSLLKSESLYWKVLKDYYQMIEKKRAKIKSCEENEEIGTYILEVHALKSSSKQIGALSLSKKAENLEAIAKRHDISSIHRLTDELLEEYRNLETSLAPYFYDADGDPQTTVKKETVSMDTGMIQDVLNNISEAIDELDLDRAETVSQQFNDYELTGVNREYADKIAACISDMDLDSCIELISKWRQEL